MQDNTLSQIGPPQGTDSQQRAVLLPIAVNTSIYSREKIHGGVNGDSDALEKGASVAEILQRVVEIGRGWDHDHTVRN